MENVEVTGTENSHGRTTVYYRYTLNGREFETSTSFAPGEVTLELVLKQIGARMQDETRTDDIPDEVEELGNTDIGDKLRTVATGSPRSD